MCWSWRIKDCEAVVIGKTGNMNRIDIHEEK